MSRNPGVGSRGRSRWAAGILFFYALPGLILFFYYVPGVAGSTLYTRTFTFATSCLFAWGTCVIAGAKGGKAAVMILFLLVMLTTSLFASHGLVFHSLPRPSVLMFNSHEIWDRHVLTAGLDFVPSAMLCIGIVCGIFLALVPSDAYRFRVRTGIVCLISWVFLTSVGMYWRSPRRVFQMEGMDQSVRLHGLVAACIMDIRLSRSEWSPEAQLKMLKEDHTVKSVPVINCVEKARRVVILQVESFDWSLLVGHFNGEDVVPFLHRVASVSPPIAVKPNHGSISGSSGSDFQVLTGFRPNLPFPVYKAAPCVFRGSLPWSCRQKGIPTAVFHGNSADFWNRREAFQRMGVGRFYSLLDFKDAPNSRWGIPDATVLQRVGDWAVTQNGTFLAFCITLSSHAPFDLVGPPDSLRTPVVERYFRSIRYVDGAIRNFVEQWPIDDTVFVLYGDHASNVRERGYMSYPGDTEIVPLLIFRLRGGEVFPVAIQAPSQPVELASLHGLVSTLLELGSSVSDLPCE